ncbi:hypothetical protein O0L34_g15159 [Tuta absoluta]|nr:hypothetical protein O0L34_g15159 [Tuta absoluta]
MNVILKYLVVFISYKINFCHGAIKNRNNYPIPFRPLPDVKEETNITSHLQYPHIIHIYCNKTLWDEICQSNSTTPKDLCAIRMVKTNGSERMESKEFSSNCYLFLSNMCDYPGQEYYISWASDCESHLTHERTEVSVEVNDSGTSGFDSETTNAPPRLSFNASQGHDSRRADATTQKTTKKMTLKKKWKNMFKTDRDFKDKLCPLTCPKVYQPVCIGINRQHGMYYKQLSFANECLGRRYSCLHPEDFKRPPVEDDSEEFIDAKVSDISWSYCAAAKYTLFTRFTETASSLGHYGWLSGHFNPRHILTPEERKPGYG